MFSPAPQPHKQNVHISSVKCLSSYRHLHDHTPSVGPHRVLLNEWHLAPPLPLLPVPFHPELQRLFQNIGQVMPPSYSKPFGAIPSTKGEVQAPHCGLQVAAASFSSPPASDSRPQPKGASFFSQNGPCFLSAMGLCTSGFLPFPSNDRASGFLTAPGSSCAVRRE